MHIDISHHQLWFTAYAEDFIAKAGDDNGPLKLKLEHTRHVLSNACAIVATESFTEDVGRAALLAALYHDTGRFPQYRDWHTFSDARSVDHALLGGRTLREHGVLNGEEARVRRLALGAVVMHNRFSLPQGIAADIRMVTEVVRDADKLDIFRVMQRHLAPGAVPDGTVILHVEDAPDKWSDKVVDDALSGRVASYRDLHYVNDFRILLGTWLHELRFSETRRRLAVSGYMESILSGLPDAPIMRRVQEYVLGTLHPASTPVTSSLSASMTAREVV